MRIATKMWDGKPAQEALFGQRSAEDASAAAHEAGTASTSVRRVLAHVRRHYAARLTLHDLAALAGQSPFQLIRAFRREVGTTPHAYQLRVRILHGTGMLLRGDAPGGVAVDLGFVDQTHFARHFKRMHGRTPRQFQAANEPAAVRCGDAAGDRRRAGAS